MQRLDIILRTLYPMLTASGRSPRPQLEPVSPLLVPGRIGPPASGLVAVCLELEMFRLVSRLCLMQLGLLACEKAGTAVSVCVELNKMLF